MSFAMAGAARKVRPAEANSAPVVSTAVVLRTFIPFELKSIVGNSSCLNESIEKMNNGQAT
jgi:hypothetical protein